MNWCIFTVMTVMNAPAIVSTVGYRRLAACTLHVIKPDSSTAFAVFMTDKSTDSIAHTSDHNFYVKTATSSWGKIIGESHLVGARRRGQEGAFALLWKMYKARFASVTTFCSAQNEPKSLPQYTFHRLKIYLNCDCGRGSSPDPHWESLQRSPNLPTKI